MKSDPADYELVTSANLQTAVATLAENPDEWLPIAGGTDVMVQFAAVGLARRKLLSIWNLPELRRIDVLPNEVRIGAGSTYTDLRRHEIVAREFPLLARAASWTGGIANQNRGTLGGNIVNASPAADSLPALLAYEAELILIAARGERRIAYLDFHTDYKKMQLEPSELIRAICLQRRFANYVAYTRKVGGRNAQAISKVCVAALGRMANGAIEDVRIALGSVAPVPIRLKDTEASLRGKPLDANTIGLARRAAAAETRPIDDIRSTAKYRAAVVANLVAEFLEQLRLPSAIKGQILARWNHLPTAEAEKEIAPSCGSTAWAHAIAAHRPFVSADAVLAASDEIWRALPEADWLEAFRAHPRIGESRPQQPVAARSTAWSSQEQSAVTASADDTKAALAQANREYERRFGRVFIVCASGKSSSEILEILHRRLHNDPATELREAVEEQRKITRLRLERWMSE